MASPFKDHHACRCRILLMIIYSSDRSQYSLSSIGTSAVSKCSKAWYAHPFPNMQRMIRIMRFKSYWYRTIKPNTDCYARIILNSVWLWILLVTWSDLRTQLQVSYVLTPKNKIYNRYLLQIMIIFHTVRIQWMVEYRVFRSSLDGRFRSAEVWPTFCLK